MAASDLINLSGLIDNAERFALMRQHRWPEGMRCPVCGSGAVIRDGCDDMQPCWQRYWCKACSGRFDDLTGTVLAGYHRPLRAWVLCLYLTGLNLSPLVGQSAAERNAQFWRRRSPCGRIGPPSPFGCAVR